MPVTVTTYTDAMNQMPTSRLIGKQVLCPLIFEDGTYMSRSGDLVQYKGMKIDGIVFSVSASKNIRTYTIDGLDTTVKLLISDGDYSISGRIEIVSQDMNYPQAAVERLVSILKLPASLKVTSPFLAIFGIKQVVVKDYNLAQSNYANVQTITVELLSDAPINLDDYVISS